MDIMDIWMPCLKKSNIGKQFLILWCYMTPCRRAIYYQCPRGKWLWWQSRCFPVGSFCKMLHKMFAEIRGKRREWPSPSLTIYAAHLCGMSAIEKCTAIALRRTSFSSNPQTVNNVSQGNWRPSFPSDPQIVNYVSWSSNLLQCF